MTAFNNGQSGISFSQGVNKFDNTPEQRTAKNFDEFEAYVLAKRSPAKGQTYFTGPLAYGPHDDPERYPGDAHFRLATHASLRRFLATDQDGYRDPETFRQIINDLSMFRGFGYTTWSHSDDQPRTRFVFELSREVTRAEGISVGLAFDRMIENAYGDDAVRHDKSVYQNEQPCYSPGPDATIFHFSGEPLDVDDLLQRYPAPIGTIAEDCEESKVNGTGQREYARLTQNSLCKVLGLINCEEEPTWHAVANAIARVYDEDGRETFVRFSRGDFWGKPYPNFNLVEVNRKYNRSLQALSSKPNGYGIKHLIHLSGLSNNDVEFEVTANDAFLNLIPRGTSVGIVHAAASNAPISFPVVGRNGKPLQVTDNLHVIMQHYGINARYNQISKRCEILVPALTCVLDETDNTALTKVIDYAVKAGMNANRIPEMVDALASQNPYCPVRTYIESRSWDGISRFHQFAGQIKSGNTAMTELFIRKWLIQAIGAAYEPKGIANAGVIVLTGAQGVGKTRLFSDLTSGVSGVFLEGQTLNPADKDSVMSAASHWVVELGELDSTFRKADMAQLKAFITRKQDTLRRPYARKDSAFPRRTVFAGTVNDYQFLHDPTGNRRFWPIDVHSISRNSSINYQQLWAEAKSWYEAGERWYLNDSELALLNQHSETFLVSDPDVEALLTQYPFVGCVSWTTQRMGQICTTIGIEKPTRAQTMRLAEAIRKYNGGQRPKESNGVKYHFVPDRTGIGPSTAFDCRQDSVAPAVPAFATPLGT